MADADQFLAMIDAKITALQALRASYVGAISVGALGQGGDVSALGQAPGGPGAGAPMDLPRGAMLGKSVPAAIKLYLSAVRQKKTTREITTALKDGGVESLAANFDTTISSALFRLKESGDVLRFDDGWALAEFYPDSFKNRLAKESKASNGKKKATKKKVASAKTSAPKGPSLDDRILKFLESHPMDWFTAKEVMAAIKEPPSTPSSLPFARLTRYGKIARQDDGRYAARKN